MARLEDGDLWILEGEVPALLDLAETSAQDGSPLYGAPEPDPDAFVREGTFIRDVLPEELRPLLAPAIREIARGPAPVTLVRGRRQRPSYRFHLYPSVEDRTWTVLEMGDEAVGELWLRRTTEDVAEWAVRPLAGAYPPADLMDLPPVPDAVAQVLLALAGLFLERFPDPDPNWSPGSLLVFTPEDVRRHLVAGYLGDSPDSLMAAVGRWLDHKWVALQADEVEEQLAVMAFRRWIGIGAPSEPVAEGMPPIGPDDYWIGHELTWWLRCLAWWDLNLVLRSSKDRLAVVQATYLYEFAREGDRWTIGPIGPDRMRERALEILREVEPRTSVTAIGSSGTSSPPVPPVARPRFCRECGQPLREGASFCPNCGTKTG